MGTLSEHWRKSSRVFRILLLFLVLTLTILLCVLVILRFVLPIVIPPTTPTPTPTPPPPVTVDFSSATYSVHEDGGTAIITVTLSLTSNLTVTVGYATSDGTATAGEDYTGVSGTLTFTSGVASQAFTVPITPDELEEGDETVMLTLSNASNATIGGNSPATLTILDDDCPSVVGFSSPTYSVLEGAGTATIAVSLDRKSKCTVTVGYAASDGTATAGEDYTAASGTLTFSPGSTTQNFIVLITNDDLLEGDETVTLTLADANKATLGLDEATLTILDDEPPITPTVTVGFSSPTYSVREDVGSATITVTLDTASNNTITVDYATTGGGATAGSDYTAISGTLTFAPKVTTQTFTVPITDDTLAESAETVALTLSNARKATLGRYTATLTIGDNDGIFKIINVLRNGDFEKGFQPDNLGKYWNGFDNGSADFTFHTDDWPLVVVEGKHTQLIEIKNAIEPDRYFGIYQTAQVIPGEVYTFSIKGLVRTNTGNVQKTSYGYRLQVGFDLKGGQDWETVKDWVELPWDEQLRSQDSFRFDAHTTTLTAKSDKLTVFVRAWKKWADAGEGDYDVDDIRLMGLALVTPEAPPIPATGAAPSTVWDNVRVWATVALLLLLLGGAIWQARRRVS